VTKLGQKVLKCQLMYKKVLSDYYEEMRRNIASFLLSIFLVSLFTPSAFAATKVFYLDLKKGCYSYTANGKGTFSFDSKNYKRLFKSTCMASHHIEVIWAGKIKTSSPIGLPTAAEVSRTCGAKYETLMGYSAPEEIVEDTPYISWFYADPGAENKKYGSKVICFIHLADKTYSNFISVKGSLVGY